MKLINQTGHYLRMALAGDRKHVRYITVFDDDVFLVSYPRSGNTWLRFLIANLMTGTTGDVVDFFSIERFVPDIYKNHNWALLATPRPRVLKSHEGHNRRYPKVIHLVRDPKDVVSSYYRYYQKFYGFCDSFESFLMGFLEGLGEPFGSWQEHSLGWWLNRKSIPEGYLLVKFEELRKNPVPVLSRCARFLCLPSDLESIQRAVERSDLRQMKKLERDQGRAPILRQGDPRRPFVAGKNPPIPEGSLAIINGSFRKGLTALGYA